MTMFLIILFWMLVGHAICDYPLQGAGLAAAKRAHLPDGMNGYWVWGLTLHALIHSASVALVTGSYGLAAGEFVSHWLTDRAKTVGLIGMKTDQAIHVACKIIWAALTVWVLNHAIMVRA